VKYDGDLAAVNSGIDKKKAARCLVVIVCSLCFAAVFGFNYGKGNQNTYLLRGLRLFDPAALSNDWFASETTSYHPFFSYLVWLLYCIDWKGWSFAVANFAATAVGAVILYRIVAVLVESKHAIPTYLILMSALALTRTNSVADSYIFSETLQPSTLGSLGLLAAILCFLKGSYLLSGVYLALGGIFHANFLILGFPVFFLAHLCLGTRRLVPRLCRQFILPSIAMLPLLPLMFGTASAPNAAQARMIFFKIRGPNHYWPRSYLHKFVPFLSWQVLGLACGWQLLSAKRRWLAFRALLVGLLAPVWLASLLTTVVFIPVVAQLFLWRMAPFGVLLCQLLTAATVVIRLRDLQENLLLSKSRVVLVLASIVLLNGYTVFVYNEIPLGLMFLCLVPACLIVATRFLPLPDLLQPAKNPVLVTVFSLALWAVCTMLPLRSVAARSNLITGFPLDKTELYAWARTTPSDTVFLTAPRMHRFRLHTRRAIVVDWKSTPILPAELLDWYSRMEDVSGISGVTGEFEAEIGYHTMNGTRLDTLRREYGIDYAVFVK